MPTKHEFLYPKPAHSSSDNPEFDNTLQEFCIRVSYIVGLENNGKLSPSEAYKQIKKEFKSLKQSKKVLLEHRE